jgi:hypothetical protein
MLRLRRVAVALIVFSLFGCGGGSTAAGDQATVEIAAANTRLRGEWVLIDFRPTQTLEPMLAALLQAQLNQLTIRVGDGTLTAQGIGISAERTYRIVSAAADGFTAEVIDPTNVSYRVSGGFRGIELAFTSETDPWRGTGRLKRLR